MAPKHNFLAARTKDNAPVRLRGIWPSLATPFERIEGVPAKMIPPGFFHERTDNPGPERRHQDGDNHMRQNSPQPGPVHGGADCQPSRFSLFIASWFASASTGECART